MFVHALNVLISNLGSHHSAGNACTYYFLNILLDTTLGGFLWTFELNCGSDAVGLKRRRTDLSRAAKCNLVVFKKTWHQGLEDGTIRQPSFTYVLGPPGCSIRLLHYNDEASRGRLICCLARYIQHRRLAPQLDHCRGRGISSSDIVCKLSLSLAAQRFTSFW